MIKYENWETLAKDIQDGNDQNLEDLIEVKTNPSYFGYKYTAYLGPWPCDIDGDEPEKVKLAAVDLLDVIVDQILGAYTKRENFGLAFYACGYDGRKQTDFIKYYADEYNVNVF